MKNPEETLRIWQKRLSMSDWRITLHADVIPADMLLPDCAGASDWREATKTACITLLREDCYGNRIVPYDPEKTLIHELLHLKFSLLGESGNELQDRIVHQLIDDMARALCDAARNGEEEK